MRLFVNTLIGLTCDSLDRIRMVALQKLDIGDMFLCSDMGT